ncbi:DUF6894 family protein [Methylobacterium nigriterrae]|uniref:DUF6894 family protein n=1 Tax=Methylobacterium nigriterrae TaxID=3127512 RepID=UPI003013A663
MPRYFFDLHDCGLIRDDHGLDLPDLAAVRSEAHRALAEIAADCAGSEAIQIRTDVRDAAGQSVLRASLLIVSERVRAAG